MSSRNYSSSVCSSPRVYKQRRSRSAYNPSPGENIYPITPGQPYPSGPIYPNHQIIQNHQICTKYPTESNQQTYTNQSGSSLHSIHSSGSQSTTYEQLQQSNSDFCQDQSKTAQPRNQETQCPYYNQNQRRRYSQSIQNYGHNQNNRYNPGIPPSEFSLNYPHYPNNYPSNQMCPQLPSNYNPTKSGYACCSGSGVGNGQPHQIYYPTQSGSSPANNVPQSVNSQNPNNHPLCNNYPSQHSFSNPYDTVYPTPKQSNSIWNSVSNFFKQIIHLF